MANKIKPRYEVEKLDGTFFKQVAVKDKESGLLNWEDMECDRGYMVYFPNGSSIHIASEKELKRLGFDRPPELIDIESGEVVGQTEGSLKQKVEQTTNRSKANKLPSQQGDK